MKTIQINLYKFSELSEEGKKKAIEEWYKNEDYPLLEDDLTESCFCLLQEKDVKYENIKLLYSLSNCQGDGLCFTGKIQKNNVILELTHNYRYYFAKSVTMEFYDINGEEVGEETEAAQELKSIYLDICGKLEKEGYSNLEYRMNNEEMEDLCEANDYYFLESGIMRNY